MVQQRTVRDWRGADGQLQLQPGQTCTQSRVARQRTQGDYLHDNLSLLISPVDSWIQIYQNCINLRSEIFNVQLINISSRYMNYDGRQTTERDL